MKAHNTSAGQIITTKAATWRQLSDEEKQQYKAAAAVYNDKRGLGAFKNDDTALVRHPQIFASLWTSIALLKEVCNIEVLCFLASGEVGGMQPVHDLLGSGNEVKYPLTRCVFNLRLTDAGIWFAKQMYEGAYTFMPDKMMHEFKFHMLTYNRGI